MEKWNLRLLSMKGEKYSVKAVGGESAADKFEDGKITTMKKLLSDRLNQFAVAALLLPFLLEYLRGEPVTVIELLALPAAGLLLGGVNRNIQSHILLHSAHLVTLFAILLLAIHATELAGGAGLLFYLFTFLPAFYMGIRREIDNHQR
jgi:hypothetical protein